MSVKLSKQRVMYVTVLGLGVAALFVDRVIVGSDATAPTAAAAQTAAQDAPDVAGVGLPAMQGGPTIAQRLETLRDHASPSTAPDGFAVIASWYADQARAPSPQPVLETTSQYRLTGVMTDHEGRALFAVINGQKIALGDQIQGIRLIDARGSKGQSLGSAVIEVDGQRFDLRMPGPLSRTDGTSGVSVGISNAASTAKPEPRR